MNETEYEKLMEICHKIDFQYNCLIFMKRGTFFKRKGGQELNVREIIFTQEFMDKYSKFILKDLVEDISALGEINIAGFHYGILKNLDNIVDYLYNLIK